MSDVRRALERAGGASSSPRGASIGSSIAGVGGSGIGGSGRSCWPSSSEPPGSGGRSYRSAGLGDQTRPATTPSIGPGPQLYPQIAGTYTLTLSKDDPRVQEIGLAGRYTMRLFPDGVMLLSVPAGFAGGGAVALGYLVPALGRPVHHQRVREFHVPGERGRLSLGTRWRSAHVRTSPRGMRGPASPVQLGAWRAQP